MTALVVNTDAGIRRSALQIAEEEALATAHRSAVLHAATQSERQLAALRDIDIQVGTVVEPVIFEGLVIIVREDLEERVLMDETGRDEIAHPVRTAFHVHVRALLPSRIVHHIVDPVRIGEGDWHIARAEMLHDILAETDARVSVRRVVRDVGRTGPLVHGQRVRDGGVVPHLTIRVGVGKIHEL